MKRNWQALSVFVAVAAACGIAQADTVKVTPLGQRAGEFCRSDRAMLFEDPTGVRLLYDPGNTIDGATDARLGDVHVILVSHAHGDHMGSQRLGTATCGGAPNGASVPNSNVAEIAAAKSSAVVAGGPLSTVRDVTLQFDGGGRCVSCPSR